MPQSIKYQFFKSCAKKTLTAIGTAAVQGTFIVGLGRLFKEDDSNPVPYSNPDLESHYNIPNKNN